MYCILVQVSHAQQLTVLQSSINTHQAHCKELEGVNSHLKLTLKQTTDQLNENIGDLSRQLDSTTQQLTKAEVVRYNNIIVTVRTELQSCQYSCCNG